MTEAQLTSDNSVAVIEGPNGSAEIFELVANTIIEYHVRFKGKTEVFNNLGEAYLTAGELTGNKK